VRPHTAIHDVESFWWVLLYVILEYSGPGVKREVPKGVRDFIVELYESGEALERRLNIFSDTGMQEALSHFDPCFAGLKDLIQTWHTFLRQIFSARQSIEYNYPIMWSSNLFRRLSATVKITK
jgi:hypothetical protein